MEDVEHPNSVVNWVKGVCRWEESIFGGALAFTSDSKIGTNLVEDSKVQNFVEHILK